MFLTDVLNCLVEQKDLFLQLTLQHLELSFTAIIIAIISTNFTQRGDISIINKWNKTNICLDNNIDLVIELPRDYS